MASTRARNLAALAVVVAAAIGGVLMVAPLRARGALDAVPANAFLVVEVDVARARASALAEAMRAGASAGVPVLGRVSETCGWDMITRVHELVVALPEEGSGAFGIAAKTDIQPEEIQACADKMMGARGGKAHVTTRRHVHVLEDEGKPGGAAIAYGEGGMLIVGSGPWFDAMLETLDGKRASVRTGDHASVRASIAPAGRPTLASATALLPEATRTRVRHDMGLEGSTAKDDLVMTAVLAVRAAGGALTVGAKNEGAEARVELRCEAEAACAEVKTLLERKRLAWSQDLRLRLLGAGPIIDSFTVEARGATVTARAAIAAEDLARLIERVRTLTGAGEAPRPSLPRPVPTISPSETIRSAPAPSGAVRDRP